MRALSAIFADWAIGLEPADIPTSVRSVARRAIIDTVGVTGAGHGTDLVPALADHYGAEHGACSAIGIGHGVTPGAAALINGAAAHVWDFDDTSFTGIMHGSAVILPVVLAAAQETAASDDDLLAAFVAGSEVTYTLADVCTHAHYFKGWWSTATFGLIGATAAAARLYGMSAGKCAEALGLAAAAAGGGKSVFGTPAKPYLAGETARRALEFVKAVQLGVHGPLDGFENSDGFLALLNDGKARPEEAESLGSRWRLTDPGLLFKTSPVCSAAHAAIEAVATLVRQSGATAGDIESIEAEIPKLVRICLVHDRPETPQQAQFSLPYALACAALHGRVRLQDLAPDALADPAKQGLMDRAAIQTSAEMSTEAMRARYPEGARIRLRLKDGSQFEDFCGEAYGMPNRPLSDADLAAKFHSCLDFGAIAGPQNVLETGNLKTLALSVVGFARTDAATCTPDNAA